MKKSFNFFLVFFFLVIDLQVAELLACMAKNPQLSFSKIVEVVAETTAPLTSIEKLLEKIPSKRPYVPPLKVSYIAFISFLFRS